ncbi:hypothetical protein DUNSADRAFT_14411 [Dunaliella salina]|uniref:Secreted protein n=1 Tax=Dunaliella salina TaxID=3046 RepID=A0ABQ7H9G5_DUNSA|nr:hypothetical protein DUNSADRAFT_14411 [Dunaliella salina]|eukprot:KAF5843495.1 hypothetical protein DUNSADRAFT_14411 [Dunaliella salina]
MVDICTRALCRCCDRQACACARNLRIRADQGACFDGLCNCEAASFLSHSSRLVRERHVSAPVLFVPFKIVLWNNRSTSIMGALCCVLRA